MDVKENIVVIGINLIPKGNGIPWFVSRKIARTLNSVLFIEYDRIKLNKNQSFIWILKTEE